MSVAPHTISNSVSHKKTCLLPNRKKFTYLKNFKPVTKMPHICHKYIYMENKITVQNLELFKILRLKNNETGFTGSVH